jgi:hypothetical protein
LKRIAVDVPRTQHGAISAFTLVFGALCAVLLIRSPCTWLQVGAGSAVHR